jgi:translation initiation factor 5B
MRTTTHLLRQVTRDAVQWSEEYGVKIFTADIIYHLFDQFTKYMAEIREVEKETARLEAVFPCNLKILPACIFNAKDPIVLGVEIVEGVLKVGTPICVPSKGGIDLGRITSIELNHKAVDMARAGQSVALKIQSSNAEQSARLYGRHFDFNDQLTSRISRESINALKVRAPACVPSPRVRPSAPPLLQPLPLPAAPTHPHAPIHTHAQEFFLDEMTKDDWRLVLKLKKVFKIT